MQPERSEPRLGVLLAGGSDKADRPGSTSAHAARLKPVVNQVGASGFHESDLIAFKEDFIHLP